MTYFLDIACIVVTDNKLNFNLQINGVLEVG
jgi:hypothetical protein